jgi:hypothetical protein
VGRRRKASGEGAERRAGKACGRAAGGAGAGLRGEGGASLLKKGWPRRCGQHRGLGGRDREGKAPPLESPHHRSRWYLDSAKAGWSETVPEPEGLRAGGSGLG